MTYVHVPVSSQHARQLADEVAATVAEYRRRHPGAKDADVREALRLAAAGTGSAGLVRLLVILGLGLALPAGLVAFMLVRAD